MFSRWNRPKGLGPRLVLATALLIFFSVTVVSSTIYFLLASSLRHSDRLLLEKLSSTYAQIFAKTGAKGLDENVAPDVLVTLTSRAGAEVYAKMPAYLDRDFEDREEIEQLRRGARELPLQKGLQNVLLLSGEEEDDLYQRSEYWLRQLALRRGWVGLLPLIDNDLVEVLVTPLPDGGWIKIGRSSEEREEQLAHVRTIAFLVNVPFVFVGIGLSALAARGVLKPLRDLAQTIRTIAQGDLAARGRVRGTEDEIDLLTIQFNALLDKNASLVRNISSTVDNVAHDLRTPLTRLRASAESALTTAQGTEPLRGALADVLEDSEQILALLNALMDVAEAESQTLRIRRDPIQLSQLLGRLVDFYEFLAEEKGISLDLSLGHDGVIDGDETGLLQALGNLVDNALKYSDPGTRVLVTGAAGEHGVQIVVSDQGIGIDDEDLPRIWERLYRGDKSRSTSGAGIGLSLVKAIISVHQGTVAAESRPGAGSRFVVTLPVRKDAERIG